MVHFSGAVHLEYKETRKSQTLSLGVRVDDGEGGLSKAGSVGVFLLRKGTTVLAGTFKGALKISGP